MARKGSTIATDLFSVTRLTNSTNGNPRYDLHTSDGNYRTQSDAACSYNVDNIARTIPHGETIPVILHTTPAGRVWDIERVPGSTDAKRIAERTELARRFPNAVTGDPTTGPLRIVDRSAELAAERAKRDD